MHSCISQNKLCIQTTSEKTAVFKPDHIYLICITNINKRKILEILDIENSIYYNLKYLLFLVRQ